MVTCQHLRIPVVLLAAFLVPAITNAQDSPPSQYERVKGLEPFIGYWVSEAGEGQENTLVVGCRWAANRSYAQFNVTARNENERTNVGTINIGWDGAEQKLAMWAFFADGQAKATPSIAGNTLKWSSKGTTAEGEKTSADVAWEVDGDTLTLQVRNIRRGDETRPEMDRTFKRRQRGER